MDISFAVGEAKFNYRVGAVMLNDGKLLAMRDELSFCAVKRLLSAEDQVKFVNEVLYCSSL